LHPIERDNTLQNIRTVQSYGYTTNDFSQLEERIDFYVEELVQACRVRLALSEKICRLRVEHGMEMNENERSYINHECEMDLAVVSHVVNNGMLDNEDSHPQGNVDTSRHIYIHSDYPTDDQTAREYRIVLWILYNRYAEIIKIENALERQHFAEDEKYIQGMIKDLIESDKTILEECMEYLEEEALRFEQFHLDFE